MKGFLGRNILAMYRKFCKLLLTLYPFLSPQKTGCRVNG